MSATTHAKAAQRNQGELPPALKKVISTSQLIDAAARKRGLIQAPIRKGAAK